MALAQAGVYDMVVGASGDQTTLALGESNMSTKETMYVKAATYAEAVTFDLNDIEVIFEPGTDVSGVTTFSGNNICVKIGSGCDFSERIVSSGTGCNILCENGVDIEGITSTGDGFFFDGGGKDTVVKDITSTFLGSMFLNGGTDAIVCNCSIQTDSGASGGNAALVVAAASVRAIIYNVNIINSDGSGAFLTAADLLFIGNNIQNADAFSIDMNGLCQRIIGNYMISASSRGIDVNNGADGSILYGNIEKDHGASVDSIFIDSGADNVIVVANRIDDIDGSKGISDTSGGTSNTIALNNETAY